MGSGPVIGVLGLQGDVAEHARALSATGAKPVTVRRTDELDDVDGLVIPGGESTTMSRLLAEFDLLRPVRARIADGMPVYGSCAGMILLATEILDAGADGRKAVPLRGIDMTVRRNAFGRQIDSFEHDITLVDVGDHGDETQDSFRAVFIRAPWVEQTGPGVSILGTDLGTGRIVAVRQGQLLATAFHPELTPDRRIHQLFVDIVKDNT